MPDNPRPPVFQRGLDSGRRPALRPTVPYRLEEWGKGRAYYLPQATFARTVDGGLTVEGKDGPKIPHRGPPPSGTFALYIGEETKLPRLCPAPGTLEPRKGRVVEEGLAYSKEDASDRADAYLRRRLIEQIGRARRRARMANRLPVAGAPEAACASASLATSS